MNLDIFVFLQKSRPIKKVVEIPFFGIHDNNFPYGISLLLQCLDQLHELLSRLVCQQYGVNTVLHFYPPIPHKGAVQCPAQHICQKGTGFGS